MIETRPLATNRLARTESGQKRELAHLAPLTPAIFYFMMLTVKIPVDN